MAVKMRNNCEIIGFGKDYYIIRDFLVKLRYQGFLPGRWDWMVTHPTLDRSGLSEIGVWEEGGDIVAMAVYDCLLGDAYFCVAEANRTLKREMLSYAEKNLHKNGEFNALIPDYDGEFQDIAAGFGYIPTQKKENDAIFKITCTSTEYILPEGFGITSMAENYDLMKYGKVLWKGFNHEIRGEGPFNPTDGDIAGMEMAMKRPNVNLNLKIAVVAPNGEFVSYCGMWYDDKQDCALVEPVATDPDYRKMGLGKAAVLEGVKLCGEMGAKTAFVGSSQQFYYSIGFRPYAASTFWKKK